MVALADAKVALVAAMTAILLEVDSEDELRKIFNGSVGAAKDGYASELNRVIKNRNETGRDVEILKGPAVTRELWIGNITKLLPVLRDQGIRDFFEAMLERAKQRLAEKKA